MTTNNRKLNKILNWFWASVLLAPIVAWIFTSAVSIFQGVPESFLPLGDFIEKFIGILPAVEWLDGIWTRLFSVNGLLPFTSVETVSLPVLNYIVFWSVIRFFCSIFIWLPCFANKLIERWFE